MLLVVVSHVHGHATFNPAAADRHACANDMRGVMQRALQRVIFTDMKRECD
jgi:hypothetical protein